MYNFFQEQCLFVFPCTIPTVRCREEFWYLIDTIVTGDDDISPFFPDDITAEINRITGNKTIVSLSAAGIHLLHDNGEQKTEERKEEMVGERHTKDINELPKHVGIQYPQEDNFL